jgi:hypothetical protein
MGFSELFRQAVRSGLGDTLGQEALAAFLYHSHSDLNKADPNDLQSLLAIFGDDGTEILEMIVARRLYEEVGLRRGRDEFFETMVDQARQAYERNSFNAKSGK